MALFLEERQIKRFNVTSTVEEPEKLVVRTAGRQWLATPNGAALLALRYQPACNAAAGSNRAGWVLDAYAFEECLPEQAMFQQIADAVALAPDVAAMPPQVRCSCCPLHCASRSGCNTTVHKIVLSSEHRPHQVGR
jgi:hypothetical protein